MQIRSTKVFYFEKYFENTFYFVFSKYSYQSILFCILKLLLFHSSILFCIFKILFRSILNITETMTNRIVTTDKNSEWNVETDQQVPLKA